MTTLAGLSFAELEERRFEINARLHELGSEDVLKKKLVSAKNSKRQRDIFAGEGVAISADACTSSSNVNNSTVIVSYNAKTDTHWDFLLKEMMWLGADFVGERKRQFGLAKKQANAIKQYHMNKETRRVRQLADAELKRRRLASKVGREVRGWWTKIERVIAYKQKLSAEKERRKAMNKQLVELVRLTERYGEKVAASQSETDDDLVASMTIEEALAAADRSRRKAPRDYANVKINETQFYGESTTEDSGSDGTFVVDSEEDDETTLKEAEAEETRERLKSNGSYTEDRCGTYVADPEELQKLLEESTMEIEDVLERLREETIDRENVSMMGVVEEADVSKRRVTFAEDTTQNGPKRDIQSKLALKTDQGFETDDDGDASDVEDFEDNQDAHISDGSGEFEGDENEVDDETTIAAEERLGREISADEEISLLQKEGEMSIEDLRKLYGLDAVTAGESDGSDDFEADENEMDDETTIAAEERLGREMSAEMEINLLEQDGEMSIEDLRERYGLLVQAAEECVDIYNPAQEDADSVTVTESVENCESDPIPGASSGPPERGVTAKMFDEDDDKEEDEYQPTFDLDDETTLEAEERFGRDMSYEDEIALLKKENEMTVDELRKLYGAIEDNNKDNLDETDEGATDSNEIDMMSVGNIDDDVDDGFQPDGDELDNETTMDAEERIGREVSAEDEITLLKRESDIPVEELRTLYSDTATTLSRSSAHCNGTHPIANGAKRQRLDGGSDEDDGASALKALQESEERARFTVATKPFLLSNWVKLRRYQQTGLNWLVSIQTRRLNGILADEMGLGKTLQTISLLAYLASYKGIWGPHLVIVPTSVIINWETELKRFCPALKVLCYYGSAKRRKELRTGWTKSNWYHVVITSYQLAVQDSFAFKRKKWYYMILDEAHNIKNFQSQRWQTLISFNSQRRLLLTGTPLQNNLTELWSLLHFLMPHVFRSRKEFSYWFSNPMNNIIEGNSQRSDELISRLHEIIRPFVLRRLKKDVETQLPGKYEHIVKCQMSRRQLFLYEEFMARSSTRQALKKGGNFMGMMNVLMQLRKVCNHPDLFEPRAVVTPFAVDGIDYDVPSMVLGVAKKDRWDTVSDYLHAALWCGSNGHVCPIACLEYDQLIARRNFQLRIPAHLFTKRILDFSICEPLPEEGIGDGLVRHLKEVWRLERERKLAIKISQSMINMKRCETSHFCYPRRLQRIVSLQSVPLDRCKGDLIENNDILSTPQQLLAMRKSIQDRMDSADDLFKKFVFCVPRAASARPRMDRNEENVTPSLTELLIEPAEAFLRPFQRAQARLSSFFPDKRLVQFDAGKLQSLSELLRELKRGHHRVLIFTQMSKMLDVLEAFLNLNGHTYLRLDGSTGVDRRQRLMDKFNNDEKVFCFILSTRSGGLGINLTGADTVVFYDSDWNPAMDAQAQDRAHRIGQTRDVHIYRLITEHSIEENIFIKAKQKRNLDLIVMDEGKFDANNGQEANEKESHDPLDSLYTKGGLLDILGVVGDGEDGRDGNQQQASLTKDQLGKAMALVEDADDAAATRNAIKEAEDDLKEFDEAVEYKKDHQESERKVPLESKLTPNGASEADEVLEKTTIDDNEVDEKKKEEAMVKEFNEWQNAVGVDADAIEASLSPTEMYALRFRESVDPFWSIFAIMEERRRIEAAQDVTDEVDIEELERENAVAEKVALDEGDLLGTHPHPEELPRQRHLYQREKARMSASKKRRKLTGENWVQRIDGFSQCPFWYDEDSGEAIWERPKILLELEAYVLADEKKWNAMPLKPLVLIMSFLFPFPERSTSSLVCRQWKEAATDVSFILHVLPVELGSTHGILRLPNHFPSISDALQAAQPGDTLELGDGHYWIKEPGLDIDFPLRLVGDEHDPSHVVIELSGTIRWRSTSGFVEGITFRRPKIASGCSDEMIVVVGGRLDMLQCVLNNHGSDGNVAVLSGARCRWIGVVLKGSQQGNGLAADNRTTIELDSCDVRSNKGSGIVCTDASQLKMTSCNVEDNSKFGVLLQTTSKGELTKSRFANNLSGILVKENGSICTPCSGNVAILDNTLALQRSVAGFRFVNE